MFDFAWSEIALIGVVALIAIGPKDLPVAIKAVTGMVKKARRMASEFQSHVDEMVREANLDEVRQQINEIRNFDIKGEVERAVDADGSLRSTFASNPLADAWKAPEPTPMPETTVPETPAHTIEAPAETAPAVVADASAPAFVPPEIANRPEPPAFVPPGLQPPGASRY